MPPPDIDRITFYTGKSQEVIAVEEKKKKMGRPYTAEAEKAITKRARMTAHDVEKLRFCCEKLGKTESEIIRLGVEKVYSELKK